MILLSHFIHEKTGKQRSNFLKVRWLVHSRARFELKKLDLVTYILNIMLFWNHIFASSEWLYSGICLTMGKPLTNSVCPHDWQGALLIIVTEKARQTKASLWPLACVSKTVIVGREQSESPISLKNKVCHLHSYFTGQIKSRGHTYFKVGRKVQPYHDPGGRELEILHK